MQTELLIEYFDLETDEFAGEIVISAYDLKQINQICPPELEGDWEYCDGVFLEEEMFLRLRELITELSGFNYPDYSYGIITRRM